MTGEKTRKYFDGAIIFRHGDAADAMYVVKSGRVCIYRTQGTREVQLGTVLAGSCFGEMALCDDKPRSASARAVGETEVEVISYAEFKARIGDPTVMEVFRRLSQRLREVDDELEKLRVPAKDPDHLADLREYLR